MPAGRATFPTAPAATIAAATAATASQVVAAMPPPPPPPPDLPAPPSAEAESAESEAALETSRAALAEAIERDFELMVPTEDETGTPPSLPAEEGDKPASEPGEAESAERLTSRENEMAQLLGEIFGKK